MIILNQFRRYLNRLNLKNNSHIEEAKIIEEIPREVNPDEVEHIPLAEAEEASEFDMDVCRILQYYQRNPNPLLKERKK